jgi:hypothetical protein
MLPTHGALHHVPLGGVAVGPSTARARQTLQHRDVLSPGGRNFGRISIFEAEKTLNYRNSYRNFNNFSSLKCKFLDTGMRFLKFPQPNYDQHNGCYYSDTAEVPNSKYKSCSNSSLLECSPETLATRVRFPTETSLS